MTNEFHNPCRTMPDEIYEDYMWHSLQDKLKTHKQLTLKGAGRRRKLEPVTVFDKNTTRDDILKALRE